MTAAADTGAPIEQAQTASEPPTRRRSRIVSTAALYFALVFVVGLALGPIRVLWLEPVLGRTIAVLCETPFLLAAIWFAARYAPRWTSMRDGWLAYLGVGLLALVFQQVADLAVGFGLRGMTLNDQLSFFATPPGFVYLFNLLVFTLAPALARARAGEVAPNQDPPRG